ncbi:MAG: HD domain-containing protein [Lachnospiraceae bacterium]|nr:HD domain-containing protein [Lachnospiraceae bacterium]
MERVNKILNHDLYKLYRKKNETAEENRHFCRHDMGHFLDVARLAMIFNLQLGLSIAEETIYAAALLHDIGRWKQYEDGTPHEKASAALAPEILSDCGFMEEESGQILSAILNHRNAAVGQEHTLDGILYRADKMSRSCFCCEAEKECDWKGDKKNLVLRY